MQANINTVWVDGQVRYRDGDFEDVPKFEVETDTKHRYWVTHRLDPFDDATDEWVVESAHDGSPVGIVAAGRSNRWSPTSYSYWRDGARSPGGWQGDLLNAVQSLLE